MNSDGMCHFLAVDLPKRAAEVKSSRLFSASISVGFVIDLFLCL